MGMNGQQGLPGDSGEDGPLGLMGDKGPTGDHGLLGEKGHRVNIINNDNIIHM